MSGGLKLHTANCRESSRVWSYPITFRSPTTKRASGNTRAVARQTGARHVQSGSCKLTISRIPTATTLLLATKMEWEDVNKVKRGQGRITLKRTPCMNGNQVQPCGIEKILQTGQYKPQARPVSAFWSQIVAQISMAPTISCNRLNYMVK